MECYVADKPIKHVYSQQRKQLIRGSSGKCRHNGLRYAVGALTFSVLVLFASNIYAFVKIYQLMDLVQSHPLSKNFASDSGSSDFGLQYSAKPSEVIAVDKRQINGRRRRHNRGRNRRHTQLHELELKAESLERSIEHLRAAIAKPVVHLRGDPNVTGSIVSYSLHNVRACRNGCFRWSNPDGIYRHNFDYVRDTAYNKVVGINITVPGIYLVYSQVAVNGPETGYDPSIGYETTRERENNLKTIMRTFITQDERGRNYQHLQNDVYPHDSISHMGIFRFRCGDVIVVKQIRNNPRFVFDQTQSFFGLMQINPTNAALGGNFDCRAD